MLKKIFGRPRAKGQKSSLQVVVISGIGLTKPSEWVDLSEPKFTKPWLGSIVLDDAVPRAEIWEFVYSSEQQDSISDAVSREGSFLFECLDAHYKSAQLNRGPLLFIAHGTGGLVLKKALHAFQSQHFHYRHVIDAISGAVFLGSPHLRQEQVAKETLNLLLRCQHKGLGRSQSSANDVANIIKICENFDLVHLSVPIISVYESRETSTQRRSYRKASKTIVPRQICTWNDAAASYPEWNFETILDSQANHLDICHVRLGGEVYRAVLDLASDIVKTTQRRTSTASGKKHLAQAFEVMSLVSKSDVGENTGLATGGTSLGSTEFIPATEPDMTAFRNPRLPCFSLGAHGRLGSFQGRHAVLKSIDDHLLPPDNPDPEGFGKLRSFAICGLGGMGKSEIAVEYAFSRRDRFEAIFWLGADDSNILAAEFASIAQRLGLLAEDEANDLAASRDIVLGWLANPRRATEDPESVQNEVDWLLVFDNVDNQDVIAEYWPKTGRGSVLVTSRDAFTKHNLHIKHGIDLEPLTQSESEDLMQLLTEIKADGEQQDALTEITQELGGFPLTLSTISGIFRGMNTSYTSFLRYFKQEGVERLHEQAETTRVDRFRSFATLWALDRLSPKTRALLEVLSILDPDNVPEELLEPKADGSHIGLEEYPLNLKEYHTARGELLSSSLIRQNSSQAKVSIHRLIQHTTRSKLNQNRLFKIFQTATWLIVATWPFQPMKEHHFKARFEKCEAVFPCVLRLKDGIEPFISDNDSLLNVKLADLFKDTGWYLFERGLISELRPFCTLSLMISERLQLEDANPENNRILRESHANLGIAAAETNEHKFSLLHKQKWLDMLLERRNEDGSLLQDYELGYAYNEIGVAYGNKSLLDEAVNAFNRCIEISQAQPDFKDTELGWPQPNLGFIYWMQGDLELAEETLVEILDIHAEEWGVDDTVSFKTGKILYAMGNVMEDQGRFQESINFHERCFQQYKVTLGLAHHRVGDIYCRLARHHMRQNQYAEADDLLTKALTIFESRPYLANERARATYLKGKLSRIKGDEVQAKRIMTNAARMRKKVMPQDTRRWNELEDTDYDALVAFWSR